MWVIVCKKVLVILALLIDLDWTLGPSNLQRTFPELNGFWNDLKNILFLPFYNTDNFATESLA